MTDAEIVRAARDFMTSGTGATTELLAGRFGVDVAAMSQRLIELEARGTLLSVPRWPDGPGTGDHYWVRPGEAAEYLSPARYAEFEQRVRALASWKGYRLVTSGHAIPPRRRRYALGLEEKLHPARSITGGQRIEKVLWQLRRLPVASDLEYTPPASDDVV